MRTALLFTVEHADNKIPAEYAPLFVGCESVLASHRGHDPGAGELAIRFATRFHAPYEHAEISRLLVDQNRSLHNRKALFSDYTRNLPDQEKETILAHYYRPYQNAVRNQLGRLLEQADRVLHLAIHSYTPELNGKVRNCDVGLMYDPRRAVERQFCHDWQTALTALDPTIRVRRNYPYRGASDGIIQALRRQSPAEGYVGLQIEINQKHFFGDRESWKQLQKQIIEAFSAVFARL
jgi:predicted N-formylglutamate amidohydrolase